MGQRDIRRLLITGAMAVVRWALRQGAPQNPWLARLLERKPPMVAASALANKMARGIWAMLTRGEGLSWPGDRKRCLIRQRGSSRTAEL
jgi:hypothetical protein